jgi:hypothetical protein
METNTIKTMFRGIVRCSYWGLHVNSSILGRRSWGSEFLSNVDALLPDCTASHPRTATLRYSHSVRPYVYLRTTCVTWTPLRASCWSRGEEASWQAGRTVQERPIVFSVTNVRSDWMYCEQSEETGIKQPGGSEVSLAAARPCRVQLRTVTELGYQVSWSIK